MDSNRSKHIHYQEESSMSSIWSQTTDIPPREPLPGDFTVDTAVIGGGLSGILTAYFLQQKGIPAVVLEADRIGSGQTRNTTAKITCQHNLIYHRLLHTWGWDTAQRYAHANAEALDMYQTLIRKHQIQCHFQRIPTCLYTTRDPFPIEQEARAAARLGIDSSFTTRTELPFSVTGTVRFENQAQFHPLEFLQAIAETVSVYENTRVHSVDGNLLHTNHGTVTARHIVFTTHYPFPNFPGFFFMRLYQERSYVLALEGAPVLDAAYLGIDPGGLSLRNAGSYLLLGGEGHRTGRNASGHAYESLRQQAAVWFPDAAESVCWSAQDCMTLDGIPYIGAFSASRPDWYVAAGFNKWGMTHAMVSAMLISDQICGISNPYTSLYTPQRFPVRASSRELASHMAVSARSLARHVLPGSLAALDTLMPGHGGIFRFGGKKTGVYRDPLGILHTVSPYCPHLGCELSWNPDECTWDCPCHGSRFDYDGHLLDNPAQTDIRR